MGKIKLRIKKLDLKERVHLLNKLANIGNEYTIVPILVSVLISVLLSVLIHGIPEVKEDYVRLITSVWDCLMITGSATFIFSFVLYSFRVLGELDIACAGNIDKLDILKYVLIGFVGLLVTFNMINIDNTLFLKIVGALSILSYVALRVLVVRLRKEILYS